jgi:hypothetical protein
MSHSVHRRIQSAAETACGCNVIFEGVIPVTESANGHVVWEGPVQQFTSEKGRIYAWAVDRSREPECVAMFHQQPIDSPLAAVRAWLKKSER